MRRVIITGGTGLIGAALAAELSQNNYEVVVLSRSANSQTSVPAGVRFAYWDGKSAQGWGELADGAYAIVNLAGESVAGRSPLHMRWTAERKHAIRQSRLDAGKAVVEAVQMATVKPQVVVQASAVGYYGPHDARLLSEEAPAGSDFLAKVCIDWEAATRAVEALGVRRVVVRIGVVLAKQGGALPLQMLPFHFFAGGPLGSGKQGFPWIHLSDVVGSIRFLLENEQTQGAYNLTAPNLLNNAEFGKALGKAMGRPAFMPTPGFVFKVAFGEAATILLDGQMPSSKRLAGAGYRFRFEQADAALAQILKG